MNDPNGWFAAVRVILELLYFASGIAIAVAAFLALRQIKVGLEQLKITKQIANTSAKREAIKLAAEQCRYFAEHAVPAQATLISEYHRLGLSFLSNPPQFTIQNGEIVYTKVLDNKPWDAEFPKIGAVLVKYLNTLESFAIPFAAGVADDELGFQETAMAICQAVQICMPALFHLRRIKSARYESTIKMYETWSKRLTAQNMKPIVKSIKDSMKSIEDLIKSADEGKIKPMGTDH